MAEFSIELDRNIPEARRLYRDLWNLYSCRRGSIPINRDFGLDWGILAAPLDDVQGSFTAEVMGQTDKYVPEAMVTAVEYEYDDEHGAVVPRILVERRAG